MTCAVGDRGDLQRIPALVSDALLVGDHARRHVLERGLPMSTTKQKQAARRNLARLARR